MLQNDTKDLLDLVYLSPGAFRLYIDDLRDVILREFVAISVDPFLEPQFSQ
jgi:hypothetical protein